MSNRPQSANDVLAFLLVQCRLPYEVAVNLTQNDPLFEALYRAYEAELRREQQNNAFLASCIYNAMGGKTKPSDFMPRTVEETEAEIKANFIKYNALIEASKAG